MMHGYGEGMNYGFMALIGIFWLLLLLGLGLVAARAFAPGGWARGGGPHGSPGSRPGSPEEILDHRFARGEIDADTYRAHRALLEARTKP
jgi:putative membrane protein